MVSNFYTIPYMVDFVNDKEPKWSHTLKTTTKLTKTSLARRATLGDTSLAKLITELHIAS